MLNRFFTKNRMKNNKKYQYNHASNKFGTIKTEALFLGLDELCTKSNKTMGD